MRDPQVYERLSGGRSVLEDFTDTYHLPLVSCRLDSRTREQGLQAGDIEPGVVFTTHCREPERYEFNIDSGGGFEGGFLDGFHHNEGPADRALRVSFTEPVRAFGFDTNRLMGSTFHVRVFHTDGRVDVLSSLQVTARPDKQFYGFLSGDADIKRVGIRGRGDFTFGFALDNFRFNPAI